jgi:hypothetical protein
MEIAEIKHLRNRRFRSLDLIATFVDDYARGWHFAVGKWFRDQLDIKLTPRIEETPEGEKKGIMQWTQGPNFAFANGQILYDRILSEHCWSQNLNEFSQMVVITSATPNIFSLPERINDPPPRNIQGYVQFQLFTPNSERNNVEFHSYYRITQDDFVLFLQTGEVYG